MTHPTVFLIEEAKNEWEQELEAHVGQIYLPDGKWKDPVLKAPLAFIEDDVWSDPKEQIVMPDYEVEMARFMDSAYAAGYCMKPSSERTKPAVVSVDSDKKDDTARFMFVLGNLSHLVARGDLFDEDRFFIDRHKVHRNPEKERTICESFGSRPSDAMKRLRERAYNPRATIMDGAQNERKTSDELRSRPIERICYLSIARKVFMARIGYPEYLEQSID